MDEHAHLVPPALLSLHSLGTQVSFPLDPYPGSFRIGRHESNDLVVHSPHASRYQLIIAVHDAGWAAIQDPTAKTRSKLLRQQDTHELRGTRQLEHGDTLLIGPISMLFEHITPDRRVDVRVDRSRRPLEGQGELTQDAPRPHRMDVRITAGEHRVLRELAGSELVGGIPLTTAQIAANLHLTSDGVRTHVKNLYRAFGLPQKGLSPPQKQKLLAQRAIQLGFVTAAPAPGGASSGESPQ